LGQYFFSPKQRKFLFWVGFWAIFRCKMAEIVGSAIKKYCSELGFARRKEEGSMQQATSSKQQAGKPRRTKGRMGERKMRAASNRQQAGKQATRRKGRRGERKKEGTRNKEQGTSRQATRKKKKAWFVIADLTRNPLSLDSLDAKHRVSTFQGILTFVRMTAIATRKQCPVWD
jgi:hypothetical protein